MRYVPVLALAAVLATAPHGFAQQPPSAANGCATNYVIGSDDVLDIAVWDNAQLTKSVPVRPDGKISLPLLNDIVAAGLTPMQLRDALTSALTEYIPRPAVSVLVKEIHSVKVSVIGHVKTPGRYELKDRATVLDVLALAGGLTEFASRSGIAVLRQDASGTARIPFAYDKVTARNRSKDAPKSGAAENLCIHPGDVVFVP